MEGWKMYNGALVPVSEPHQNCNVDITKKREIWKETNALFIRYTSEFDCCFETEWWYCIKDTPFSLQNVNAKKRYEIKRGIRNIKVKKINVMECVEQLISVRYQANRNYPISYRPSMNKKAWRHEFETDSLSNNKEYWGMFENATGRLVGYSVCLLGEIHISLSLIKIDPNFTNTGVNAALIYTILDEYINSGKFKYISDGERNVLHDTNYQEYLIKYFGFRRAYCRLNLIYRPTLRIIILLLFPFRHLLSVFKNNRFICKVIAILKMEQIRRSFER